MAARKEDVQDTFNRSLERARSALRYEDVGEVVRAAEKAGVTFHQFGEKIVEEVQKHIPYYAGMVVGDWLVEKIQQTA